MNLVNSSNRYTLPIYLVAKLYADTTHMVSILCNNTLIYEHTYEPGIEHTLKIDQTHDFQRSDVKKFCIKWQGQTECENKYFKFKRLIVNQQEIGSDKSVYAPYPVEYFNSLNQEDLNSKIKYHGHEYGWFGDINFVFLLADRTEKRDRIKQYKHYRMLEINMPQIFVDTENKFIHTQVQKNVSKQI